MRIRAALKAEVETLRRDWRHAANRRKTIFPARCRPTESSLACLREFIRPTNDDATVDRVLAEVKTHIERQRRSEQAGGRWLDACAAFWRSLRHALRAESRPGISRRTEDAMSMRSARFGSLVLIARNGADCLPPKSVSISARASCRSSRRPAATRATVTGPPWGRADSS